jgi:hypothetical protein
MSIHARQTNNCGKATGLACVCCKGCSALAGIDLRLKPSDDTALRSGLPCFAGFRILVRRARFDLARWTAASARTLGRCSVVWCQSLDAFGDRKSSCLKLLSVCVGENLDFLATLGLECYLKFCAFGIHVFDPLLDFGEAHIFCTWHNLNFLLNE